MNPVVVLGKGPSAMELKKTDTYDVAVLNNAFWLCEAPTFVFFNDLEPMELTTDEDFSKVTQMVVPTYMHSQFNPRFDGVNQHFHFSRLFEFFPKRFDHVEFHLYELHDGDSLKPEEVERTGGVKTPSLDEWPGSTGVTAINVLLKYFGYKEFILSGIDPSGGYHPVFENKKFDSFKNPAFSGMGTAAQPAGYDIDYQQMIRLATKYEASVTHKNDLTNERRQEIGL